MQKGEPVTTTPERPRTTTRPTAHRPGPDVGPRVRRPVEAPASRQGAKAVVAVRRLFAAETSEYFLLLGATVFLVAFGLVMVLSSSSIQSGADGGDFFARASRQGLFALIGLPIMLILARLPVRFWRRWSWAAIVGSVFLQLLVYVPGLRYGNGYNTNWIRIGPVTAQPSEFIKLALVVWFATILARKQDLLRDWKHVAIPIIPVAVVAIGLVLGGGDLGTAMILFTIVLAAYFFAAVRLRIIAVFLLGAALVAYSLSQIRSSRVDRIQVWLQGCTNPDDALTSCYQTLQGWYSLAHGGVFGSGLGNSIVKWSWLPAADNDFIFAVIGDELGLVGAIVVLLLFVLLAFAFVRIIRMQRDMFPRVVVGGVMVWVIGQAFVNIAVVLGLLPVLGVPLPLVSAGGTALIGTMAAIGIVLSFARHHPDAADTGLREAPAR
ncbi:MAG: putative lipid II flippase FtsW [Micrococcales bacterium]|nr:putative lipid II flippase FtsW [Micrococcales bacterium]